MSAPSAIAVVLGASSRSLLPGPRRPSTHGVAVTVNTWDAGGGRAYVGVKARGPLGAARHAVVHHATTRPGTTGRRSTRDPVRDQWSVKVHTCSGSTVNPLEPDDGAHEPDRRPGIGIRPCDLGRAQPRPRRRGRSRDRARRHRPNGHGRAHRRLARRHRGPDPRRRSCPAPCGSSAGPSTSATAPTRTIAPSSTSPNRLSTTHAYGAGRVLGHGHRARHGSRLRRVLHARRHPVRVDRAARASTSPTARRGCRGCRSSTSRRS